MKTLTLVILIASAIACSSGCARMGLVDNGTHLAHALEQGARELRASTAHEYIVRYQPLGGLDEAYEITMRHSHPSPGVDAQGAPLKGSLLVTGRFRGATTYHERFVFTPRDLHIRKTKGATEVVLRKVGDRIDVVELR